MKKIFTKENLAQVLKLTLCVMCCLAFMQMITSVMPTTVFCDDLFEKGTDIVKSGQSTLVSFAMALAPLALILICVLSMVTHNEKKLAWLMNLGKVVLIASILILVINSGIVIDTIKAWFE